MPKNIFGYRFIIYLPVLLLFSVASFQIFLSYESNLSAWSGGGFGMFSTTDAGGSRHLHAFTITPDIRREIMLTPDYEKKREQLLALPSEYRIRKFAKILSQIESPDEGPGTINITIWKTTYDPVTLEPATMMLKSMAVHVNE